MGDSDSTLFIPSSPRGPSLLSHSIRTYESRPSQSLLPRKSRITRHQLLITSYVIHVVNNIAYTLINSFYPHEADRVEATETEVGFVFCAFAVPIFTFAPLFGLLSHRVGYKLILIIGLALEGVCLLSFLAISNLTGSTFILVSMVLRFMEGIGSALAQTGCYALLAAESTEHGSAMGVMELMGGLGQMFGPLIGGALYDARGFDFPFLLAGSIFFLLCGFTWWIMPSRKLIAADVDIDFLIRHSETAAAPRMSSRDNLPANVRASMGVGENDSGPRVTLRDVLMCRSVPYSCLVALSALCMNSYLGPTLEPHLSEFDVSQVLVGFFFMMASIAYTITSPIAGRLADRYGPKTPMLGGLALVSFALVLLGPSPLFSFLPPDLWLQCVGLALLGTGVALAVVPTFADMIAASAHLGDGAASVVAGLSASIFALGEILGPLTGSSLSDHYTFAWASTLFAGMCTSVLCLAILLVICGVVEWVPGSRVKVRTSSMDQPHLTPKDDPDNKSSYQSLPSDSTHISVSTTPSDDQDYDMVEPEPEETLHPPTQHHKQSFPRSQDEQHQSLLQNDSILNSVVQDDISTPASSSPRDSLTDSPVYVDSP